jgi:hypothetical protein
LLVFGDGRIEFTLDGGHGAEDLRAAVGECSGTFGGDAVWREELEKPGEEEVDLPGR